MEKKTKKVIAPKVTLMSYTIKAVIPTGQYANIQSEITVNAPTLELAESYVMPYINGLIKQYSNCNEKEPIASTKTTVAPTTPPVNNTPTQISDAFLSAEKVLNSAVTTEAITTVMDKINNSKKLTSEEKAVLIKMCEAKLIK